MIEVVKTQALPSNDAIKEIKTILGNNLPLKSLFENYRPQEKWFLRPLSIKGIHGMSHETRVMIWQEILSRLLINDGASFFVLASAQAAERSGQKPLARLVSYAVAGVPNEVMGEGPIPASKLALSRAGLTVAQMDVVESNEAFAVQSLTVAKALGLDLSKTNVNGGAIALGHPIGASGAAIATKAIYELHRSQGKYALVTMCIGGGQGIAVIFERL